LIGHVDRLSRDDVSAALYERPHLCGCQACLAQGVGALRRTDRLAIDHDIDAADALGIGAAHLDAHGLPYYDLAAIGRRDDEHRWLARTRGRAGDGQGTGRGQCTHDGRRGQILDAFRCGHLIVLLERDLFVAASW
jgi:hypothetical protein